MERLNPVYTAGLPLRGKKRLELEIWLGLSWNESAAQKGLI